MGLRQTINSILEDFTDENAAIDQLYQTLEDRGYDWGNPDAGEFKYVMNTIAGWVRQEKKKVSGKGDATSPEARSELIGFIKEYVTARPTAAFMGIHPAVFGVQLALRVRRPRSIDQGGTGLCGAVSVLYAFAKAQPIDFARFAVNLFFDGKASFRGLDIEPSPQIRQGYVLRKSKIPWAVDYVTMVSLRQCTFISDKIGVGFIRGADETTLPGQLGLWLSQAGYSNVEDHTFFGKNQQKIVKTFAARIGQSMHLQGATGDQLARTNRLQHAKQSLTQAGQALAAGKLVILFSDGELGHMLQNGTTAALRERTTPTELGSHHWMAVRKLQIFGDSDVKLKAITWGNSYQGLFKLDAFVSRYNGYVTAEP